MLISLVGLPGSGKSTVGRQLARRLALPFVDSDAVLETELGCPIRTYFETEGEARFREVESVVLEKLLKTHTGVLATGGGIVLREINRTYLQQYGHRVYLHASPEDLFRRLRYDTKRPLLQVNDPLQRLKQLYAERDPLYREVASFSLETGRPSVSALVRTVLMQLEMAGIVSRSF